MAGFIQEKTQKQLPLVPHDFRHSLCTGETGSGKTSSFILPNLEARLKDNYGILVIDFKGNMHSMLKVLAQKTNRLEDVVEIGVPWGSKINLFKNTSRALFLDTLNEMNGQDKDRFWITSALNLAGHIYDILTLYENITNLLKDNKKLLFNYKYDAITLNKIFSSFESLQSFIKRCESIIDTLSLDGLVELHQEGMHEKPLQLIAQFVRDFKESTAKINSFYEEIDKSSPASGNGGVFFVLRNLLSPFLQAGLDGQDDLKSLLEQGKVVVIRSDSYDETITMALMNILYKQLLIRNNSRPISLFIDEFQRTVSEQNIPYVDLFREMKVELIAALQNIDQLDNTITKSKCDEFMGNILHNYNYADHRENTLASFEYLYRGKKSLAEPIFISQKESVLAQLKWQEMSESPLDPGWIYHRMEGYKRAIIINIRTKERRFHYILDQEDSALSTEIKRVSTLKKAS